MSETDNRRTSFRCPNTDADSCAVLRHGRKDRQVELVDQSAQGFSVTGDRLKGRIGQRMLLRTPQGWSEVEVARREQDSKRITLGLKRISDLADPRELKQEASASLVLWGTHVPRPIGGVSLSGTLLLSAVVAVLGFWVAIFGYAWFR